MIFRLFLFNEDDSALLIDFLRMRDVSAVQNFFQVLQRISKRIAERTWKRISTVLDRRHNAHACIEKNLNRSGNNSFNTISDKSLQK